MEAVFFDPEPVSRLDEDAVRLVPFLPANAAKLLLTESDRETFKAGALCAQPDAVLELPAGLIALEYKSKGGRFDDPLRWAETMRTKDLIQTVLAAAALSVAAGRPAAPVLRTTNAVFFLRPTNSKICFRLMSRKPRAFCSPRVKVRDARASAPRTTLH